MLLIRKGSRPTEREAQEQKEWLMNCLPARRNQQDEQASMTAGQVVLRKLFLAIAVLILPPSARVRNG